MTTHLIPSKDHSNLPVRAAVLVVRAAVMEHLLALGNTPRSVAEALQKAGARGVPAMPCDCPVSVYLVDKLAPLGDFEPVVGSHFVEFSRTAPYVEPLAIPLPVTHFIEEFDGTQGSSFAALLDCGWPDTDEQDSAA